tara:strand:+ start:132566 stop:132793 length:228 start_codon:yes stop_codon:yes gene_type:complete
MATTAPESSERLDRQSPRRAAVSVFDSENALEQLVEDLESHGFDRADISLLADESTVEENARVTDVDQPAVTGSL